MSPTPTRRVGLEDQGERRFHDSVVTWAELPHGVQLSSKKKANQVASDAFTLHVAILDFSVDAAAHYADVRARDFGRVKSLRIETWVD